MDMAMKNEEFRVLIKHYYFKSLQKQDVEAQKQEDVKAQNKKKTETQKIKDKLDKVYGESAPSYATVSKWIKKFKNGDTCTKDKPRSGRPKKATMKKIKVEKSYIIYEGWTLPNPVHEYTTYEIGEGMKRLQLK